MPASSSIETFLFRRIELDARAESALMVFMVGCMPKPRETRRLEAAGAQRLYTGGETILAKLRHFTVAELLGAGFDSFRSEVFVSSIHRATAGDPLSPGVYVFVRPSTEPSVVPDQGFRRQ